MKDNLPPRQRELADLVWAGYNNTEIAQSMGITVDGVKTALSVLYRRLGVQGWGSARVRLFQMLTEERAQYATNWYAFPVGV